MDLYLVKKGGILFPADEDAQESLKKIKEGKMVKAKVTQPRNLQHHKKFFAALNLAFDAFEPITEFKGRQVQKSFDRFRKDVIILAGHYDIVANVKNEVRYEAKSISFANMSQDEFDQLYTDVVNVLLREVLVNYTRSDFDKVIQELIRF